VVFDGRGLLDDEAEESAPGTDAAADTGG
jgi:hypothetical protein